MSTSNKYALITGASSGIGWHISVELASRGYSILAVSNQETQLADLKKELEQKFTVDIRTTYLDLSSPEAAEHIYNYCQNEQLNIEVLVNNAGILVYGEVVDIGLPRTKTILHLHMNTPVLLSSLFARDMLGSKKGYILNVSSISAKMPYPTISLYGPTKTFLRYFTRALRTETSSRGLHVSCLMPGATATALYDPKKINISLAIRLGIMKKPEVVAKAGIRALFNNKAECVPGILNKFTLFVIPFIPHFLITFIYKVVNNQKRPHG